jgi:methionine aminopeptidase
MSECAPEKSVVSICELGDNFIIESVKPFFKKNKKMTKGVAFPTCISVNSVVSHFSPNSDDTTVLKAGDVVKM